MAHIVVTGGNSRAAKDIIKVLVSHGHQITILDLNPIEKAKNIFFVECDLRRPELFKEVVGNVIDGEFGKIEAIVNLARTPKSPGLIKSFTKDLLSEWKETFAVQVFAPYFFSVEVAENEKNKNHLKSIVNISSILSQNVSNAESASYHSSKAALESISRILAIGLGRSHVRVNTISPGYIENKAGSISSYNSEVIKETLDSIRIIDSNLEPTDIGGVIAFLISPEAKGISGQVIVVDQGLGIRETLDASIKATQGSRL